MRRALGITAVLGVVGCGSDGARIDPFPVPFDQTSGAAVLSVSTGNDAFPAVVDTLAPVTVIDSFVPGSPEQTPRRREVDLVLHAAASSVPRVAFDSLSAFDLHPCTPADALCTIGLDGNTTEIQGIVGADALSRTAVRLEFATSTMKFFPDIAGDDAARGRACDAVFPTVLAGGGTLVLEEAEINFSGDRVAIGTCLHFDVADKTSEEDLGADALLLLSTGIAITAISETTYERYRQAVGETDPVPPVEDLPSGMLSLPSGQTEVRIGTMSRIALVGEGSDDRGPCQELYANHVMTNDLCADPDAGITECPCTDARPFCSTAAAIEIDRPFQIAVMDDLDPLLQSLRSELRPTFPEVDGILGANALAALSMDVDYPNSRLVSRCMIDDSTCLARPAVRNRNTVDEIHANCPLVP